MKKKSAILPFRYNEGNLEILLIKNTHNTKWVIPKGTIERPLAAVVSATKEAYEEAGVLGTPWPIIIGTYHKNGQEVPTYLLEVSVILEHYEEGEIRLREWHKFDEIDQYIVDNDLLELLKIGEKVITKNGYLFKHAIQTYCEEYQIAYTKITKKEAHLQYKNSAGDTHDIALKRKKTTLTFSHKRGHHFVSLEAIPTSLMVDYLHDNAQNQMGYWSLVKEEEAYTFYRMYNEELKVLNCELFLKILSELTLPQTANENNKTQNELILEDVKELAKNSLSNLTE